MTKLVRRIGSVRLAVRAWIAVAGLTAACASLPPTKPVTSVGEIVGRWEGTGQDGGSARVAFTQTFKPDGTYTAQIPTGTVTGTVTVSNGKLRGKSDQTGRTGTYTLYEGEGRRVLTFESDDGRATAEMKPAK